MTKYINYVINSSASFGDGKKPGFIAKEEFEQVLEDEATWHLDKEALAVYHTV
ncbi:19321_t:CDS:2 [Funneliformis geosporum]|nr:19321_t:CDS:2 [Funneliformis geosporum]